MQVQTPRDGYKDPRFCRNPYQLSSIPSDWEYVELGSKNSGMFSNGVNKPAEAFGHGTLFVNLMDIFKDTSIHPEKLGRVEVNNKELESLKLNKGDVLLVRSSVKPSGVGYPTFFESSDEPVVFSGFVIRFRPNLHIWDYKFLTYLLRSNSIRNNVIAYATISANTNINQESYKKIPVVLPPLREQQKIASILSKVDELIQKTDQVIEQTQRLKKGLMQRLLTKGIGHTKFKKTQFYNNEIVVPESWSIIKLTDNTLKIGSGITPRGGSKVYGKRGIPLIRSQNVHFEGLKLDDVAYIPQNTHDEMKNTKLQNGDVLLNITGASIGRCTFIPAGFGEGNVNQHVCIIRPTDKLNPIFLSFFLSSQLGQKMILRSPNGLSREGLNFKEIGSFLILLPPMEEQQKIANRISLMNMQIKKEKDYKYLIERLKKGLMQKLLTGKIRVKL